LLPTENQKNTKQQNVR